MSANDPITFTIPASKKQSLEKLLQPLMVEGRLLGLSPKTKIEGLTFFIDKINANSTDISTCLHVFGVNENPDVNPADIRLAYSCSISFKASRDPQAQVFISRLKRKLSEFELETRKFFAVKEDDFYDINDFFFSCFLIASYHPDGFVTVAESKQSEKKASYKIAMTPEAVEFVFLSEAVRNNIESTVKSYKSWISNTLSGHLPETSRDYFLKIMECINRKYIHKEDSLALSLTASAIPAYLKHIDNNHFPLTKGVQEKSADANRQHHLLSVVSKEPRNQGSSSFYWFKNANQDKFSWFDAGNKSNLSKGDVIDADCIIEKQWNSKKNPLRKCFHIRHLGWRDQKK